MPLTECPECGEKLSTRASICPHCGFPFGVEHHGYHPVVNARSSVADGLKLGVGIFAVFLAGSIVIGLFVGLLALLGLSELLGALTGG